MDNENKEIIENKEVVEKKEVTEKKGFFKRMSLPKKIIFIIVTLLIIVALGLGITYLVLTNSGKGSLYAAGQKNKEAYETVQYNGQTYVYNDKLINILAMGIDQELTIDYIRNHLDDEMISSGVCGGQADAQFIITIDPDNKKVSVLPINRNSMTEIQIYDGYDEEFSPDQGQILLQHAYGSGLEDSCELQVQAVSKMLHDIPINGYISINLPAIRALNDVVGGVEVTVLDNIPPKAHGNYDYGIGNSLKGVVGQKITLNGNQAYAYMRYRNTNDPNSNEKRLERQKQYIKGLAAKMKEMTKKDVFFPLKVKEALDPYLVTDIDMNELMYIVTTAMGYDMNLDDMEGLPGELYWDFENILGYKLDQDKLKDLLIRKFYKVKN